PQTFFDKHIAVANAACLDFHANPPAARLRDVAFHQFKISTGFANLRRVHLRAHKINLRLSFAPSWLSHFHRGICRWFKALSFQLTQLRRVETVCERYCRTVAVERSGAAGSTSPLRLPGNANAVTWQSRRHKRLRRQHEDRLHWRFLSQ